MSVAEIASKDVYRKRKSSGLCQSDRVAWERMTGIQQMDKNNSLLFQFLWNGCLHALLALCFDESGCPWVMH
ncbi:unnamed protein product [Lathyrus sativus]|nr:unnamed protein product [Lathyrus sativus]